MHDRPPYGQHGNMGPPPMGPPPGMRGPPPNNMGKKMDLKIYLF